MRLTATLALTCRLLALVLLQLPAGTGTSRAVVDSSATGPQATSQPAVPVQLPNAKPCASVTMDGLCCNPGALNVGPMLRTANATLKAAAAWCNTSLACAGFTAKANPNKTKSIAQQCMDTGTETIFTVYFKTMLGGNADPLWSSWRKIDHTPPVYYCHKRHCRLCDVPGVPECVANVSYTQPDCFGQCNGTTSTETSTRAVRVSDDNIQGGQRTN